MNETLKNVIVFVSGAIFGGVACMVIRYLYSRANANRVGTDTNVIGEVASGVKGATDATETIQSGIERIAETAGTINDLCAALAGVVGKVEERQSNAGAKE